ncbi:MAG: DUF3179 domain-containing (seleno)protein [Nannocystaceae bacterium]
MCNSGVGLTPRVRGKLHHFSAGGLYNGLILLIDDETKTYWDHITGEAVHGELVGATLGAWPLEYTTVATALAKTPGLMVSRQIRRGFKARMMAFLHRRKIGSRGFLPPMFRRTMGGSDARLPEMTQGLGVTVGDLARFYPSSELAQAREDDIAGRCLHVELSLEDRVPGARWGDGTRPMQLFTRWYGFSSTYPNCEVYSAVE